MTAMDIAKVMGNQFIAIKFNGEIRWSGGADKFTGWLWDYEVKSITAPRNEWGATIIEVEP